MKVVYHGGELTLITNDLGPLSCKYPTQSQKQISGKSSS